MSGRPSFYEAYKHALRSAPAGDAEPSPDQLDLDYSSFLDLTEYSYGSREDAHALGAALEAARAEEKWAAQSSGTGQQSFGYVSLLQSAEQDLGPDVQLDTLVPGLRALNQRVVVLEDKEKRVDLFKKWFSGHDLAVSKVIRESIGLLTEKPADYLFLDFDIHDKGDRTLREWLKVKSNRELDGLDLAAYVAKKLPPHLQPKNIIVHSRNKAGREMMMKYLRRKGLSPVLWKFYYTWEGFPP